MNYCPNCGTANRDGSRFCNECGHKLPSKTGIICPMCSHVNPAGNVYCDNCQARLVPLTPSSQPDQPPAGSQAAPPPGAPIIKGLSLPTKPAEPEPAQENEPEDMPEWLIKLRAAAPRASEVKPAPSEPEPAAGGDQPSGDMPDWMRPATGDEPDWFRRISESQTTPPASQPAPQPSDEDLPDWLKELGVGEPEPPAAPAAPPPQPAQTPVDEEPDWLKSMREEPTAGAPDEEVPDWLKGMDLGLSAAPEAAPAREDTSLDWLTGSPEAEATPLAEESISLDWLDQMRTERAEPESEAEAHADVPDWLSDLRASPPADEAPAEEPAAAPGEEPDWLASLGALSQAEPPAETEASEEPDWLAAIRASSPQETDTPEPAEAPAGEADWLRALSEPASAAPGTETPDMADDVPAWLRELPVEPAPQPAEARDVPDWLRGATAEESEPAETPPVSAFVGDEVESIEPGEVPAWFAEAGKPPPAPSEAKPAGPAEPVELPDWLRDLGPLSQGPAQPEGLPFGEAAPTPPGQLPDWLKTLQPSGEAPAFADESGKLIDSSAEDTGLEAAAIPSWLEALRPSQVSAVPAAPEDGFVESEGVLAGLRSVLPASPLMASMQGAPAATRLQIPAADISRAGLFQELLARGALAPTIVQFRPGRRARMGDRISRWIIAFLIIFAAAFPNGSGLVSAFYRLGDVDAGLFDDARSQIDSLGAGDTVLMAFDYDPFQSGEMDPIAEAYLMHLQQKGASVTVVSTNPAGGSIASRLLDKVNATGTEDLAFDVAGFFPGQAAGIQSVLTGMRADVIIVLAGSPESMRLWIEQSALTGLRTPILAGLSAGALPQVQPYLQSGQVQAAVSGLMGGLAYQRALDPELDADDDGLDRVVRSESLYLVQLVFALILFFGIIVSLLMPGARRAG